MNKLFINYSVSDFLDLLASEKRLPGTAVYSVRCTIPGLSITLQTCD